MNGNQKVALITGANRGIGFETARQLGKQGVTVIIGARDEKSGEAAVEKLRAEKISAESILLDVANAEQRAAARKYIEQKHGKLDILINNAGVMVEKSFGSDKTNLSTLPLDAWRKTFDTNFFGPIALTQELLPLIRKSPAGRIVNLSSILGSLTLHSEPGSPIYDSKIPAYDVSKTALNGFTVHLAHELKDTKIKVNSAHPGWVKTNMGGEEAPMEIEDGAKTSVRLALLPDDGPTGGYFHMNDRLPW